MCLCVLNGWQGTLSTRAPRIYKWQYFLGFWLTETSFSSFSGLGIIQYGLEVAELHGIIHHRNVLLTSRYCTHAYLHKGCHQDQKFWSKYPNHLYLWQFSLHCGVLNWMAFGGLETRWCAPAHLSSVPGPITPKTSSMDTHFSDLLAKADAGVATNHALPTNMLTQQ